MIPANTQIWLVAGTTDMRRGFTSLSGLVQSQLDKSPLSGQVFVFRGRRGDLVKLIWHDGDGTWKPMAAERAQTMATIIQSRVPGKRHEEASEWPALACTPKSRHARRAPVSAKGRANT